MNLDFQAGGSPLAARMNPVIYVVIILGFILIAILVSIALLYNMKKQKELSPEFIEAQKNRVTTRRHVKEFCSRNNLNATEEAFLWKFCKKYQILNIIYSSKELDYLEPFFKQFYAEFRNSPRQDEINIMFKLKFKFERFLANSTTISSTKVLAAESKISEIFPDGSKAYYKIFANEKDYLAIDIPQEVFDSAEKPDNLEKVAFTFTSETGMNYAFVSRVMRYEQKGEHFTMLVSHSTDLIAKQQRNFKRISVNERCRIASVSKEKDKKGNNILIPSEKKFDCMLINVSGGGCCISTTLPVKESQLIYVEFTFPDGERSIFGKIIKTRKARTQGLFNLHIQFKKINQETQNKILAKVYGYN